MGHLGGAAIVKSKNVVKGCPSFWIVSPSGGTVN